jgi:hypothetical protein
MGQKTVKNAKKTGFERPGRLQVGKNRQEGGLTRISRMNTDSKPVGLEDDGR